MYPCFLTEKFTAIVPPASKGRVMEESKNMNTRQHKTNIRKECKVKNDKMQEIKNMTARSERSITT